MLNELSQYNHVLSIPTKLTEESSMAVTSLELTPETFDPTVKTVRPPGWLELKMKRVAVLEQTDRIAGVSEADIIKRRQQREEDVSCVSLCS
jgi:hypothetical protein